MTKRVKIATFRVAMTCFITQGLQDGLKSNDDHSVIEEGINTLRNFWTGDTSFDDSQGQTTSEEGEQQKLIQYGC